MRHRATSSQAVVSPLESRIFLSGTGDLAVTQIQFPNFSSTTNLLGNGFGATPINAGARLRLTDGATFESRSVWYGQRVPIEKFNTDFSFVSNASSDSADGLTFTVQTGPTSALGAYGQDLGYAGIGSSQAVALNMFNHAAYGSKFGFASNGERPPTNTDMSPIDMHGGHRFLATVRYDGTTLLFAVRDSTDRNKVFSSTKTIDLPTALGSSTAIVGFTAGTGTNVSTQDILSWEYSGTSKPTVAAAAAADPNPVTGKTTPLSVLGADLDGESGLKYTWTPIGQRWGSRAPVFSVNGTNAAKSTIVTFLKDGTYRFRCTISNANGGIVASDVSVVVKQTATAMRMSPHKQTVPQGGTVDYHAAVLDQFHHSMRTQPSIVFSVRSGPGTIDSVTGLFTASSTIKGHVQIAATAGDITGIVGATVT
jgi:hypothetical protein